MEGEMKRGKNRKSAVRLPVCEFMCATCPFRPGSPYADLVTLLNESGKTNSRICHSTGAGNAINRRTGKPEKICRGSRDQQLKEWFDAGFIEAPTDAAWNKKCDEMGITLKPTAAKAPAPGRTTDNQTKLGL